MDYRPLSFAFIVATTLCQIVFCDRLVDVSMDTDFANEDKVSRDHFINETARINRLSDRVVDCPQGWVYAGDLGCFYFNTQPDKVKVLLIQELYLFLKFRLLTVIYVKMSSN